MWTKFFYLFTLLPIIWEAINLTNPRFMQALYKSVLKLSRYNANKPLKDRVKYSRWQMFASQFQMVYTIWSVAGLFCSQWPFFLGLWVVSFIPKKNYKWRIVDAALCLILLFAIAFNKWFIHYKFPSVELHW